jgi:AcrR family transcriptional regulator
MIVKRAFGGTMAEAKLEDPAGDRDLGRRGGRRQGSTTTREEILRSARKLFAELGYRGATTRAIAQDARVDPALIHHFFHTKEELFNAAISDAFRPEAILDVVRQPGDGGVGERLIRGFLRLWDDREAREPMLAVVRSSMAYDDAAHLVSEFVTTQVIGEVVKSNATSHAELRTTLVGAQMIGILVVRYVLAVEPFASLDPETLAALLGPGIDRCLAENLDLTT